MKSWIAVHGPIGSGKSSLARALEDTHLWVNFTDLLKEKACFALYPYRPTTVREVHLNKEVYRPYIQAFGDLIGFTDDPKFVFESLEQWSASGQPDCVFDNVRSVSQAMTLQALGFKIVKLVASNDLLRTRTDASESSRSHRIEQPLPDHLIDVYLDASFPLDSLVKQVRAI